MTDLLFRIVAPSSIALAILLASAAALLGCDQRAAPPPAPALDGATTADPKEPAKAAVPDKKEAEGQGTQREYDAVRPTYPAGDVPPNALAARFCAAVYGDALERRATCCQTKPSDAERYLDRECTRLLSIAIADGSVVLAEDRIAACETAATAQTQGCDWVTRLVPPAPDACQGLIEGTRAAGASCRSALECKSGLRCAGAGSTQAGKCANPGSDRAACGGGVDVLAAHTAQIALGDTHPECAGFCAHRRCRPRAKVGETCNHSAECGPENRCLKKRCVKGATSAIGQPCDAQASCDRASLCTDGRCAALLPGGAACSNSFQCVGGCLKKGAAESGICGPACPGT